MTIPTPTSNGVAGLGAGSAPGIPDEATLGRLASEFFRLLPGSPEPSFDSLPTSLGAGSTPAPELSLAQSGPSIAPAPIAPDPVDPVGSGGAEFGVPEAYAAALPGVTPPQPPSQFADQAPLSPPGSPYYFLGEATPYSQSGAKPSVPENRVVAQSYGLPGEGELKSLLAEIAGGREPLATSIAIACSALHGFDPYAMFRRCPTETPTRAAKSSRASGVSSSGWLVWMTTKTAARRRSNGASAAMRRQATSSADENRSRAAA